jgi:hypothetical protein
MAVIIKVIIGLLFGMIFFALGSALYFLIRDSGNSDRIVKALSWRIGLSILLFILLFVAFSLGWIVPHSIAGR